MNIGEKILELRKEAKLSQEQLAEKLEVTRQTISKWENGDTCPDINQASKIAKFFDVSLDELTSNLILTKIDVSEKKYKKYLKMILVICSLLFLIIFIEIIAVSFYFLGTSKAENTGSILLSCYRENEDEENIYIHYDNTNDIINIDGSEYIFERIINENEYSNAVKLITDITMFFEENNGYCK